jgi:hypothetical protein
LWCGASSPRSRVWRSQLFRAGYLFPTAKDSAKLFWAVARHADSLTIHQPLPRCKKPSTLQRRLDSSLSREFLQNNGDCSQQHASRLITRILRRVMLVVSIVTLDLGVVARGVQCNFTCLAGPKRESEILSAFHHHRELHVGTDNPVQSMVRVISIQALLHI